MKKTEKTISSKAAFFIKLIDESNVISLYGYTFKQNEGLYYANNIAMDFDTFEIFLKGFFLENNY